MKVQSQINYFSATGVAEGDCIVGNRAVSSLLQCVLGTCFLSQGIGVSRWQNSNGMLVNFNEQNLAESNNLLTHTHTHTHYNIICNHSLSLSHFIKWRAKIGMVRCIISCSYKGSFSTSVGTLHCLFQNDTTINKQFIGDYENGRSNQDKNRRQIVQSFKRLRQRLKIKGFCDITENTVRAQICSAIITYCLVAVVQYDMHLKRSAYEVLQTLGISLTDTTPLRNLLGMTCLNDVKELDYPLFKGLFNYINFVPIPTGH